MSHKNGAEHFSAIFLGSFGDKQATAEFPDEKNSTIGPTFGKVTDNRVRWHFFDPRCPMFWVYLRRRV